ncbi:MAG: EF-P lysine aminoacylase GenX [Rhodospirillaceae bacterium]|nr:EF-P lysine aminoacylase GenX [Rhodospirillaceae bacterium]
MTETSFRPREHAWWHPERLAQRRPYLDVRRAAIKAVRAYFQAEGFVEVETPAIQISPGIERHIRPFTTSLRAPFDEPAAAGLPRFLHTSPEFAMKKLMAGGMTKIVQLCHVWRDGERSALHHPEFTMLEWYRVGADYGVLMADCEALMRAVARGAERTLQQGELLRWQGRVCDPAKAAERLTVHEAFARYSGIDLLATIGDPTRPAPPPAPLQSAASKNGVKASESDSWEDVFFRVMLERVEPQLGIGAPTILCEYPANLAALARRKPSDARVAERFEIYACGVELANAFSELTDPIEQRLRFAHDRALHAELYGTAPPLDEDFLTAVAQLPPCAGAALGFDRLVMLAAGASDITDVLWAPVV